MFFSYVKKICFILVLSLIISPIFFLQPELALAREDSLNSPTDLEGDLVGRTEQSESGFSSFFSMNNAQANISSVLNTLSLKVYCGITKLFADSCGINGTSTVPVATSADVTTDDSGTAIRNTNNFYVRTEDRPTTITGAGVRNTIIERVVEKFITPVGVSGVSADYVDARLAELAAQLRNEMMDRTVTVRTGSTSNRDSISSKQVDSIYEDMGDNIDEAIENLNDLSDEDVIALIVANSSSLPVGTAGYVLQATGTSTQWVATSTLGFASGASTQWDDVVGGINFAAGNVGIGNASPLVALDIQQTTPVVRLTGSNTTGYLAASYIGLTEFGLYTGNDEKIAAYDSDMGEFLYANGNLLIDGVTTRSAIDVDAPRFTADDGAANNPAFTFGADSTVGIFRPAASALGFTTGSTERMRILANGNVGIGTTTPQARFHVATSTTGSTNTAIFENTSTGASDQFRLQMLRGQDTGTGVTKGMSLFSYGSGSTGGAGWADYESRPLQFWTGAGAGATQKMTITASGDVGVGSTTPSSRLVIAGSSTTSGASALNVTNSSNSSLFFVRNDGNIGVGTTSPSAKFDVWGSLQVGTSSTPTLSVNTSTGRVGINTAAQYAPLYVYSTQEKTGLFHRNTTANLQSVGVQLSVLTGFSDQYQKAGIFFQRDDSFLGGFGAGKLIFAVNNTADGSNASVSDARMTILPNGNVGIGTTTPAAKLDLYGGDLYFGQNTYDATIKVADIVSGNALQGGDLTVSAGSATAGSSMAGGHLILKAGNSRTGNLEVSGDLRLYAGANNFGSGGTFGDIEFYRGGLSGSYTQAMTLSGTTGYFGIGTTSPSTKLEVFSSGEALRLGNDTNASTYIGFAHAVGSAPRGYVGVNSSSFNTTIQGGLTKGIEFNVNNNTFGSGTAMVLTSAGNVGIGTSTPGSKLDISAGGVSGGGVLRFSDQPAAVNDLISVNRSNGTLGWRIQAAGGGMEFFRITDSGGAPRFLLEVSSAGNGYFNAGSFGFGTTTPTARLAVTGLAGTGDVFAVASSTNARMLTVTSAGNVGIGTTTPERKLQVSESSALLVPMALQNTSASGYSGAHFLSTNGSTMGHVGYANASASAFADTFYVGSTAAKDMVMTTNGAVRMTITSAGLINTTSNVGIGTTTPYTKLVVAEGSSQLVPLVLQNTSSGGYSGIHFLSNTGVLAGHIGYANTAAGSIPDKFYVGSTASKDLIFTTNGTTRLTVASTTGNVGIGITSPGAQLDVANILRVSGAASPTYPTTGVGFETAFDTDANALTGIASGGSGAAIFQSYSRDASSWRDLWFRGNNITFNTNGATLPQMIVNSVGNVGIGTTTPGQKLSVVGSGQFTAVGSDAYAFDLNLTADGTLTTSASDERLKEKITALDSKDTLDRLMQLKPSKFDWRSNGAHDIGLIAQEVEEIFPELVFTNKTDGFKGINYSRLPALLVSGMQELNGMFDSFVEYVEDGVAYINEIVVKRFTAKQITVQNEDLYKTGVTIYDQKTGEPICMFIFDGEMKTEPGRCEDREEPEEEDEDEQQDDQDNGDSSDDGSGVGDQTGGGDTQPVDGGAGTGTSDTGDGAGTAGDTGTGDSTTGSGTGTSGDSGAGGSTGGTSGDTTTTGDSSASTGGDSGAADGSGSPSSSGGDGAGSSTSSDGGSSTGGDSSDGGSGGDSSSAGSSGGSTGGDSSGSTSGDSGGSTGDGASSTP